MGRGEAEQLAGAARLRDLPRERTRVDALGPLLLSLPLLAPALPLPPLALLLPLVLLALVPLMPLPALPLSLSLSLTLTLPLELPVRPVTLLVVVLQVLVLPRHGHGARSVLSRLGGAGKRRAAAPIAAGAGAPHRVATAAIIFRVRGPAPLSAVAPPDRVVAARAATPMLAVPAAVIVVGTAAFVIGDRAARSTLGSLFSVAPAPILLCNTPGGGDITPNLDIVTYICTRTYVSVTTNLYGIHTRAPMPRMRVPELALTSV